MMYAMQSKFSLSLNLETITWPCVQAGGRALKHRLGVGWDKKVWASDFSNTRFDLRIKFSTVQQTFSAQSQNSK